ncbi:MAG: peptidoglycan-binding domain-containing protein [Desertimonas sp.]
MRRPGAFTAVVGLLAGCGGSADSAQDTLARIPTESTTTTTTSPPPPTPVPGHIVVATTVTTTAAAPPATPVPGVFGQTPSTTASEAVQVAQHEEPLPTAIAPTTTIPMMWPPDCSPGAIAQSTGIAASGVTCRAGWATATVTPCPTGTPCPNRDVFHLSGDGTGRVGWVHLGPYDATCAEHLTATGMTHATAAHLAPTCDPNNTPAVTNIPPGSDDPRVPALQVALIAHGYVLAVDGTYGPNTERAVRDFQRHSGLEIDGIAGPNTQAALGM